MELGRHSGSVSCRSFRCDVQFHEADARGKWMIFQILAECTVFCERRNALTEFPMMDRCRRSRSALERIYAKVLENFGGLDRGITPDECTLLRQPCSRSANRSMQRFTPTQDTLSKPHQRGREQTGERCGCGTQVERVPERAIASWASVGGAEQGCHYEWNTLCSHDSADFSPCRHRVAVEVYSKGNRGCGR